jgi:hypothetical protein
VPNPRLQDYVADQARDAAAMAFRYARAVPDEKLNWAPEGGRSVLEICRELAVTPTWTLSALGQSEREWSEETMAEERREQAGWLTVDVCELEFWRRFERLETLFLGLTNDDLAKTKWLPYNGGRDHTYLEMMDYPRWNCTYRVGQIAYLQTLYGDRKDY